MTHDAKREFLDSLSPAVRAIALKYPVGDYATGSTYCYRSSEDPLFHYAIMSYVDDPDDVDGKVMVTLVHGQDSPGPGAVVFGQDPAQLTRCNCGHWLPPTKEDTWRVRARAALDNKVRDKP